MMNDGTYDDINSDTWDEYEDRIDEWRSDIEELET